MPANRFVEALKRCLRARGMTYAALARELRISEASVKRMFSRSSFTLSRIEEILAALGLDLHEVARMSLASAAGPAELTLDQETALAKDERLISVFWLVLNGWRYEQIAEAFSISRAELTLVFARLDRLKLIEWGKGERARLRVLPALGILRRECLEEAQERLGRGPELEARVAAVELRRGRPGTDCRHESRGWSASRPDDDLLHGLGTALQDGFDTAVGAIAHPARDAKPPCFALQRVAESDALHAPADTNLPGDHAACRSVMLSCRRGTKKCASDC